VRVLVTRPEPDAQATAARLEGLGHEALVAPLLTIRHRAPPLDLDGVDALVFTSRNGVRAAACHPQAAGLKTLPAFVVGQATGAAARAEGFAPAGIGDRDAAALAALITGRMPAGSRLLHLSGAQVAGDLHGPLAARGIRLDRVVLYESACVEALPPSAEEALARAALDAVLLYSPRTARCWCALAQGAGLGAAMARLRHLCLSPAVAAPLLAHGLQADAPDRPNDDALLARLLDATPRGSRH
jgi:uroporphyrinogen-III synthase